MHCNIPSNNFIKDIEVDACMTTVLRMGHSIRDFESWKKMFDSDPLGRKKSGVRRYRILRPTDDPNYVMIDLEFDNSQAAESFRTALNNMWRNPEAQRIMQNPEVRVVEQVENQEY